MRPVIPDWPLSGRAAHFVAAEEVLHSINVPLLSIFGSSNGLCTMCIIVLCTHCWDGAALLTSLRWASQ